MEDDPRFQVGAYQGQKSPGLYMDGMLVQLLMIFARNIVKDNQFTGMMCSSTFGVRTGKSTLAQQIGYYYTYLVNKLHGRNISFDVKNIVFSTTDLEKRAFEVERYSCLILDEGEGLDEHMMSKKYKALHSFLRRNGQLNLFVLIIYPDFFSTPKFLAMNRTNFLIDVKFEGEFDRGYFEYYNFTDKKNLYIRGKKNYDYSVQKATIQNGRFVNKYCVDEQKYRDMKKHDLEASDAENKEEKIPMKVYRKIESEIFTKVFKAMKMDMRGKMSVRKAAKYFGRSERTCHRFLAENEDEIVRLIKRGNFEREDGILARSNDTTKLTDIDVEERDNLKEEEFQNETKPVDINGDKFQNETKSENKFQNETKSENKFQNETNKNDNEKVSSPEGSRTDLNNGITRFDYEKK